MKVKTWIDISQEVDVTIDIEDVIAEFASLEKPKYKHEVMRLLSMCVAAIDSVPDELIDELGDCNCKIVHSAMERQLNRYKVKS